MDGMNQPKVYVLSEKDMRLLRAAHTILNPETGGFIDSRTRQLLFDTIDFALSDHGHEVEVNHPRSLAGV